MERAVSANTSMRGTTSRRRLQNGSTAIEFAFVIIPLIWLIGYIIEAGLFLTAQYELQNAVQDASRKIRTGTLTPNDIPTFKAALCAKVVLIRNCTTAVKIDVSNASTTTVNAGVTVVTPGSFATLRDAVSAKSPISIGPATSGGSYTESFAPGAANTPGAAIVTYDWPFVVPFIGTIFSNLPTDRSVRRLYGIAVYKNENYS